jgi:predicted acylesterase/phospholipase RssA
MISTDPFDAVVFAGGGTRCFWQLGFWSVAAPELRLAPRVATAVSAGSAIACAALLGRCAETLSSFQAATARNPRNAYARNVLGDARVFPHYAMYHRAVLDVVDADELRRLQVACDLRILVGHPPAWLGPHLGLLLGLGCYLVARRAGDPVHGVLARRLGFSGEAVSVRRCRTPEELADLVLASSCTPPFTPLLRWGGRPALDGGVVDNAPVTALPADARRVLVLLTRRHRTIPSSTAARVYLAPSQPVPIRKWDYTSPQALGHCYDLGRRDAETFLRSGQADGS